MLQSISRDQGRSSAKLSSAMRSQILSRKVAVGDPLPSEREMAEHLGVSRTLVRATFRELEEGGLVQRVHGRVRRVARSADAAGGIPLVGIIGSSSRLEPSAAEQQGWDDHVALSTCNALQLAGRSPLLVGTQSLRVDQAMCGLPANTVGVILAAVAAEAKDLPQVLDVLDEAGVPVVASGSSPELASLDRVVSDHAEGAAVLTRWLLERGRRRVLPLWSFAGRPHWLQQRELGYASAMREAGHAPLDPLQTVDVARDPANAENFELVTRMLAGYLASWQKRHGGFDALMVATDRHALEAAAACRVLGLEPGRDVVIVGYDDCWAQAPERCFEASVPAATINKNNYVIGQRLASLLERRLDGKLPDGPVADLMIPTLVIPGL